MVGFFLLFIYFFRFNFLDICLMPKIDNKLIDQTPVS